MGLQNVIVETDSKLAVQLIFKPYHLWHWKLVTILLKIVHLCKDRHVKFKHVFRESNQVADFLAASALKDRDSKFYNLGELPIKARQLAYNDKNGLTYLRKCKG